MKVLIDIGHPGHVHLFKNLAHILLKKGHSVLFTVREKEHEIDLLKSENLPFTCIGKHFISRAGKAWGLIYYNLKILLISFRFKPDMYLSHGSVYTLLSAFLSRKPNYSLEDTGNHEQVRLYLPFTKAVITSTSFPYRYGAKQVFYNGFHELAYLHPDHFSPDPSVREELGLTEKDQYFILRFVAWNASHDRNHSGLTPEQKNAIIELLALKGHVYISSEAQLPTQMESLRFPLRPERMHHALAFATLFVGEGATMASESAILGTAAILVNTIRGGILEEQEKEYGLVTCFSGFDGVMEKISELLDDPLLKSVTKSKSERLIHDKTDLTEFLVRFLETRFERSVGEI